MPGLSTPSAHQIIYTRNTTESINSSPTRGRVNLKAGDLIILTEMEHHSNLVPWQILQSERGIELDFILVTEEACWIWTPIACLRGAQSWSRLRTCPTSRHDQPGRRDHPPGARSGRSDAGRRAQSVPHLKVDVQALDADFLAFSEHKMCGPTGIGALYGKMQPLAPCPFMGGGDMIKEVKLRSYRPNTLPYKFEAGTPAIAESVGFGAAVEYLSALGMDAIASHEARSRNTLERLGSPRGQAVRSPAQHKGGVAAFTSRNHPHDVAQILDQDGIAIRAGHHCAQPCTKSLDCPPRAAFRFIFTTPGTKWTCSSTGSIR